MRVTVAFRPTTETLSVLSDLQKEASSLRPLAQRLRSRVIGWTAGAMNWVSEHCCYAASDHDIGWRDHLRWALEDALSRLFDLAYSGSDEEIQSVFHGEIPPKYMSGRQHAVFKAALGYGDAAAWCSDCGWKGQISECAEFECPRCGHAVWVEEPSCLPAPRPEIDGSVFVRCTRCNYFGFPDAATILGIGPIWGCPVCDAIQALLVPMWTLEADQ